MLSALTYISCTKKQATVVQPPIIQDKERINQYNTLDNLKEGLWYVDKWKSYAKQICDNSKGFDCSVLGEIYHERFYGYGSKAKRQEAVSLLNTSCEKQDSRSCLKLGILATQSDIPIVNSNDLFIKAHDIALKKCEQQYIFDCMTLSLIYFEGYGSFERDRERAKNLARYSCDNGYAMACIFLGTNADNREELQTAHTKACKLGITTFC